MGAVVMRSLQLTGEVCLDERIFDTSPLEKGRRPGPTPIDKAHWRFRIARQAKMAQYEAETAAIWWMSDYLLRRFVIMMAKEKARA